MKDMMTVLVQFVLRVFLTTHLSNWLTSSLTNVSDPKQAAPDGQTIGGRMEILCEAVAGDIKECANVCDAYLK